MRSIDHLAISSGIDGFTLMKTAGTAVADAIASRWSKRSIVVLCGPGNNGGDGFVAAYQLRLAGWPVKVSLLGTRNELSGDAARAAHLWDGTIEPFSTTCLESAGIIVDAIFGAGLSRPIAGTALSLIQALQQSDIPICAIDVPSGVNGSTGQVLGDAASATLTVTFFRKKPGHLLYPGRKLCGDVLLAEIGIPASLLAQIDQPTWENEPDFWQHSYPWPKPEDHKYKRGEVLLLGGAELTGACRLTATAASRAGAGVVTVAAPANSWIIYATSLVNALVRQFENPEDFENMLLDVRRNVIAIGPGAGVNATTRQYVLAALATRRTVVLDADALTAFTSNPDELFSAIHGPCVLTPHAGEFKRLFHFDSDKLQCARSAARQSNAVVVYKGADTVIAAPDGRAIMNTNAPPQLATAGSGDILTGIIAALLAQGMALLEATAAAVWLHGAAAEEFGLGLVADDLPDLLPAVLQKFKASLDVVDVYDKE